MEYSCFNCDNEFSVELFYDGDDEVEFCPFCGCLLGADDDVDSEDELSRD